MASYYIRLPQTGGGGAADFIDLGDVPNSYSGQSLKFVRVNAGESGLEFTTSSSSVAWGAITGTLSDQTDLQSALDGKADVDLANVDAIVYPSFNTAQIGTQTSGEIIIIKGNEGNFPTSPSLQLQAGTSTDVDSQGGGVIIVASSGGSNTGSGGSVNIQGGSSFGLLQSAGPVTITPGVASDPAANDGDLGIYFNSKDDFSKAGKINISNGAFQRYSYFNPNNTIHPSPVFYTSNQWETRVNPTETTSNISVTANSFNNIFNTTNGSLGSNFSNVTSYIQVYGGNDVNQLTGVSSSINVADAGTSISDPVAFRGSLNVETDTNVVNARIYDSNSQAIGGTAVIEAISVFNHFCGGGNYQNFKLIDFGNNVSEPTYFDSFSGFNFITNTDFTLNTNGSLRVINIDTSSVVEGVDSQIYAYQSNDQRARFTHSGELEVARSLDASTNVFAQNLNCNVVYTSSTGSDIDVLLLGGGYNAEYLGSDNLTNTILPGFPCLLAQFSQAGLTESPANAEYTVGALFITGFNENCSGIIDKASSFAGLVGNGSTGTGAVITKGICFEALGNEADERWAFHDMGEMLNMFSGRSLFGGSGVPISSIHNAGSLTEDKFFTPLSPSYGILQEDHIILVDTVATAALTTLTLPLISDVGIGKVYVIKDSTGDASTYNIQIDSDVADTIDGATSFTLALNYGSITLRAIGANSWGIF
jgi:hypothetical protein